MNSRGFDLERGELNSEAKHKTVAEFKQAMADKEIEQELVTRYGAPEYIYFFVLIIIKFLFFKFL